MTNTFIQRVKAASITAAPPSKDQFPAIQHQLDSQMKASGLDFKTVTLRPGELYPTLAYIKGTGFMQTWHVNVGDLSGKKLTMRVSIDVNTSNEIYRSPIGSKSRVELLKDLKRVAAGFKKAGLQCKINVPEPVGDKQSTPYAVVVMKYEAAAKKPEAPAGKPSPAGSWGIEVSSGDGKRRHVFTSTENSYGPWPDKDTASSHVRDLQQQLAYDDDFKYPTFKVVRV